MVRTQNPEVQLQSMYAMTCLEPQTRSRQEAADSCGVASEWGAHWPVGRSIQSSTCMQLAAFQAIIMLPKPCGKACDSVQWNASFASKLHRSEPEIRCWSAVLARAPNCQSFISSCFAAPPGPVSVSAVWCGSLDDHDYNNTSS